MKLLVRGLMEDLTGAFLHLKRFFTAQLINSAVV